jgi:periplasmic mercuric ion binding protein
MRKSFVSTTVALACLFSTAGFASERTVTLAVQNMYCAACPYTVKSSLQSVTGVKTVLVSFENKTAIVAFDDAKTSVAALTKATTDAGYPSAPKN